MYLKHFSLNERPFTISPDPRFLFMSNRYREALAHLTYGVEEGGGFVLLTGEVGTGKTTVCRCLLQQLPQKTRLAFVLNPKLNSLELLATICDELKIDYPENTDSLKLLTDRLSEYLLKSYQDGFHVVVMIDEAQNLATEVLEQIRLLTNLETNQKKLLQIILVGQPELQEKLAQRDLRQLAQRITARYHLRPLSVKETIAYILHRVRIAGCHKSLFSRDAIEYLHAKTQGIPRLVNTICDRALFAAASRNRDRVDKKLMAQAINEVMGESFEEIKNQRDHQTPSGHKTLSRLGFYSIKMKTLAATVFAVLIVGGAFWMGQQNGQGRSGVIAATIEPGQFIQSRSHSQLSTSTQTPSQPVQSSSASNQSHYPADQVPNTASNAQAANAIDNLVEQLIGDQRWDNNGNLSMQALFKLWQIDYSPFRDGNYCDFALSYGLKCENQRGQWQQLREFNRPAILKFSAGLQGEFWGTLKSIQGLEATMVFGEKQSVVSLAQLSTLWSGDFVILWQSPQGYQGDIKLGDQGEAVSWLSQNLNELAMAANDPRSSISTTEFDSALKQQLLTFQRQRNINADGIAGMQTILKINSENLTGIPLLVLK